LAWPVSGDGRTKISIGVSPTLMMAGLLPLRVMVGGVVVGVVEAAFCVMDFGGFGHRAVSNIAQKCIESKINIMLGRPIRSGYNESTTV
jgi:hypothetical protein